MTASNPVGAPVWVDLGAHDIASAQDFYRQIFGWEFSDQGEAFGHYSIITAGGGDVGGAMRLIDQTGQPMEADSAWTVYLRVDDAQAACERARAAGGQVVVEPMVVGDEGTMAIVIDPAGAAVGMWQPHTRSGFALPLTAGTPVWFECMTTDFDAALAFYREVFGWDIAYMGADGSPSETPVEGISYATANVDGASCAGICDGSAWGLSSHWRWYVGVDDADATAARIEELGGRVLDGPMDSPFGRCATVADREGAGLQIIEVQQG